MYRMLMYRTACRTLVALGFHITVPSRLPSTRAYASPALAAFRTDGVKADLPAGKQLPFLYSTKDIPTPPPSIVSDKYVFEGFTAPTPPAEETSYELDPGLIQLVGVLCLIGSCLGLVVYAILSIDE